MSTTSENETIDALNNRHHFKGPEGGACELPFCNRRAGADLHRPPTQNYLSAVNIAANRADSLAEEMKYLGPNVTNRQKEMLAIQIKALADRFRDEIYRAQTERDNW